MKSLSIFLLVIIVYRPVNGQQIFESYTKLNDTLRYGIGENDFLTYGKKGYTLLLPDQKEQIKGVIISLDDSKPNLSDTSQIMHPMATAKGFAVLYISSGVPLDLYFSENSLIQVDTLLLKLFKQYNLPNKNIFFLGVNVSGHRDLKYLEYCKKGKSKFNPDTIGVILCDGILDWVRQWYEDIKGIKDDFSTTSVFEGKLIVHLLETNLGGTPKNMLEKYLDFSPYSYFDETDRHIKYFKDFAFRSYSEPAINWRIENSRKGVYETNFPDHAGIINALKLAGNKDAELFIFWQQRQAQPNPIVTWSLVDKKELVDWVVTHAK